MDELSQGDGLEFNGLKTGTKSNEETEDEESMNFIEELKKPDQIAVKIILILKSRENSSPSPTGERKEKAH